MESYSYDAHGNLLTFNNGFTAHTYTYGDSEWKDLLSAVDGVPFLYDALGNPLRYYNGSNYSLNWTEGRKLATITTGGKTTDYLYDASGNRIKKTNDDDSYIIYVNANGVPLGEKHYNAEDELVKTLRYIYDENGSVCGYIANSADGAGTYHFIKNLQGDVTHVYRLGDNAIVASYSYDSWGNIISATGEKAEENPFRYRGYYYDAESGFYATGSRYYDPEIGRFINIDDVSLLGANGDFASLNLYAYCGNNPIIRADTSGEAWHVVAGALIGAAFELGSQLITNKGDLSSVNWTKVAIATVVGGVTAACGPWSGALISGVGNVAIEAVGGTTDVRKLATSFAVGVGSSLIGAGVGKVVQKIGGKIAINQLAKKSSSEIKRIVLKTINVAGRDRNAIKNLSWTMSQSAYKHLPDELIGKTVPQIFNSFTVGILGYGTMGTIYEQSEA